MPPWLSVRAWRNGISGRKTQKPRRLGVRRGLDVSHRGLAGPCRFRCHEGCHDDLATAGVGSTPVTRYIKSAPTRIPVGSYQRDDDGSPPKVGWPWCSTQLAPLPSPFDAWLLGMAESRIQLPGLRPLGLVHRAEVFRLLDGQTVAPELEADLAASRALLRRQTERIADRLEAGGIPARRPDDGIVLFGAVTGTVRPAEARWRHLMLLPEVQACERSKDRLKLAAFLQIHPKGKYARYAVVTSGIRCGLAEAQARLDQFIDKLRRWTTAAHRKFDVQVVLRAVEITIDHAMTVHIHANLVYIPMRFLGDEWSMFLRWSTARFGAVWEDQGRLRDVAEVLKYTLKFGIADAGPKDGEHPQAEALKRVAGVLTAAPAPVIDGAERPDLHPVVQLHQLLMNRHLVQPIGRFREFCREIRETGVKLWRDPRGGQVKAVRVPKREIADDRKLTPSKPLENWILAVTLPWPLDGRHVEPVAMVAGYTETPTTLEGQRGLDRLRKLYANLLREDHPPSPPPPGPARLSIVHTSTISAPRPGPTPPRAPPPPHILALNAGVPFLYPDRTSQGEPLNAEP